jgi:hypothetical protein
LEVTVEHYGRTIMYVLAYKGLQPVNILETALFVRSVVDIWGVACFFVLRMLSIEANELVHTITLHV